MNLKKKKHVEEKEEGKKSKMIYCMCVCTKLCSDGWMTVIVILSVQVGKGSKYSVRASSGLLSHRMV